MAPFKRYSDMIVKGSMNRMDSMFPTTFACGVTTVTVLHHTAKGSCLLQLGLSNCN
jgi:hypothetical protein